MSSGGSGEQALSEQSATLAILQPGTKGTDSPFSLGDVLDVWIVAVGSDGHGVGFALSDSAGLHAGTQTSSSGPVFDRASWLISVPTVLRDEVVRVRVYANHDGWSSADLVEVVRESPQRVQPPCEYFRDCHGCALQHLPYNAQLQHKEDAVRALLRGSSGKLGIDEERLSDGEFLQPIVGSPMQLHYRTKITPHFDRRRAGEPVESVGFNYRGRNRKTIDIGRCVIATEEINNAYMQVRGRFRQKKAPVNSQGNTLLFRHTLLPPPGLKRSELGAQVASDVWPPPPPWTAGCISDPRQPVLDVVNGRTFRFIAHSFYQPNSSILPSLVGHVRSEMRQHLKSFDVDTLVDAYCGAGMFALSLADDFSKVVGVEIDAAALEWAKVNARDNRMNHCEFYTGAIEDVFRRIPVSGDQCVVVMDPPESGSSAAFLDQLLELAPPLVIYVSCDPKTQIRDIALLRSKANLMRTSTREFADQFPGEVRRNKAAEPYVNSTLFIGGKRVKLGFDGSPTDEPPQETLQIRNPSYRIASYRCFDFFPQTSRVEAVAVLVREG